MFIRLLAFLFILTNAAIADDGNFHGAIQATDITSSGGKFYGDGSSLTNLPLPTLTPASATHSITSACNANGWQISSTKPAMASYTVKVTTTATIGGASDGAVVLKTAPTNSSTAGDWVEASRASNGQTITLAIVLQSVQNVVAPLFAMVPAGYYACLQSVTASGTPTYAYVSGQETTIG